MSAHENWESVLQELKKQNPKDGNFYMITVGKTTGVERRTSFLSWVEAVKTVMYEIEKSKLPKIPMT